MLGKRAREKFFLFNWCLVKDGRRTIKSGWRLAGRGSLEMGYGQLWQRLAGDGLALLLRFSGDRSFQGGARNGEAWRGRNDIGDGRLGFGEQSGNWVHQRADHISRRHRGGLQGFMVVEHPSGEHCLRRFLNPLINQSGDFSPQIRSVVEARQLKTLQGSARGRLQIVERRTESRNGHGQSSNLRAGPKGPSSGCISAQY
jgi:hypothetical protein